MPYQRPMNIEALRRMQAEGTGKLEKAKSAHESFCECEVCKRAEKLLVEHLTFVQRIEWRLHDRITVGSFRIYRLRHWNVLGDNGMGYCAGHPVTIPISDQVLGQKLMLDNSLGATVFAAIANQAMVSSAALIRGVEDARRLA